MKKILSVWLTAGLVVFGEAANLSAAPKTVFLKFNGTNSAVLAANSTTLGEGSVPLTVSVWVKPAVLGTPMVFVSKMAGASVQWALGRDQTNRMIFAVMNSAGQLRGVAATSATADLNWHHVAGVFDGAKISLYVDGVSAAPPTALAGAIASSHFGVCLGGSWNSTGSVCSGGPFLNGSLDEVRIYLRALPETEIQATMNVELTGTESGLALYYNLNDGAGQVAYDLARGFHGILGNSLAAGPADPVWVGSGPDTTKPIAFVTFPTMAQSVNGQITVTSFTEDNVGVVGVQYKLDGVNFGPEVTTPPFSTTLDPAPLSAGNHTIAAIARDAAGNDSVGYNVTFTIPVNPPPPPPPPPPPNKVSGCFNQSLGNGWTCIDSNAVSGAPGSTVSLRLVHDSPVPAHSTIVLFTDAEMYSGDGTMTCSDNAQNVFTRAPMGAATIFNQGNFVHGVSYWYVLDAKTKASGYQASCTFTTTGVISDLDMSVMVFKQASGQPSAGIDTFLAWNQGNSGSGPCPCEMVPGGQTLFVSHAGDLILGGGNMNGSTTNIVPPFAGVDGDGFLVLPAYFTSATTSSAPGNFTLSWYESLADNGRASTVFAFLP